MLKLFARLAGLTAVLATLVAPSAHAAQFRVGVQVGAPVVVAPPPVYVGPVYGSAAFVRPGYVWQPGYYVRVGFGRRWVPGVWMPRSYGARVWRGGYDRYDRRWRR